MSWFNRTPRLKETPKHLPPRRSSPLTRKVAEEDKSKTLLPIPKNLNK